MRQKNENLCKEIARLTCKYRNITEVDCIYLLPYNDNGKDIYDLIVVFSEIDQESIKDEIIEMDAYTKENEMPSKREEYGGELRLIPDTPEFYVTKTDIYATPAELKKQVDKTRCLVSSSILYDRFGFYTRVAKDKTVAKFPNSFKYGMTKELKLALDTKDKQ